MNVIHVLIHAWQHLKVLQLANGALQAIWTLLHAHPAAVKCSAWGRQNMTLSGPKGRTSLDSAVVADKQKSHILQRFSLQM